MDLNRFHNSKIKAALPTLIAIFMLAVVGSTLFLFFLGRKSEQKEIIAQPQAYRMQIGGLNFKRMNLSGNEISITADRFIIKKGKIGFFSTGLMSTARIENARIDIYAMTQTDPEGSQKQKPTGETSGNGRPEKAATSQPRTVNAVPKNWSFGDLFGKETFSSLLPSKNISAIEAVPVTVSLHGEQGILTQISAASASVRLKDRNILFNGKVRVSSGGTVLSTERLVFNPQAVRLITDQSYILQKGGRTIRGSGLTTDIFLSATDLR